MTEVYVVGIPKSGTNAAEKVCKLLGKRPKRLHTSNWRLANDNKVLFIYRNPRNVVISAVRYQNQQVRDETPDVTDKKIIDQIYGFFNTSLRSYYEVYYPWLNSKACKVKFADLVSNPSTVKSIIDYMGSNAKPENIVKNLPGGTGTWTGKYSDWTKYWSEEVDKVWKEEGMVEMEKKWGFDND